MKKKQYIAPETVIIKVDCEGLFLRESDWTTGGVTIPIKQGDPDDPSVNFSKEHNGLWDEEFDDAKDNLNDKW